MSTAVVLPGASKHLPEYVGKQVSVMSTASSGSLADVLPALQSLAESEFEYIIGSTQTPCIWWFAAHLEFPAARMLCQQADGSWLNIAWSGLEPAQVNLETDYKDDKKPTAALKPEPVDAKEEDPRKWPYELFLVFAQNRPEAQRLYDNYLHKAQAFVTTDPRLIDDIERYVRQGKHAAKLSKELLQKLDEGSTEQEALDWINKKTEGRSQRVAKHLNITFKKKINYKKEKRQQLKENKGFNISLQQVELEKGVHPQSVRALKPAQMWDVYIDETGTNFSLTAEDLKETDKRLGRIVALALPAGHGLKPLKKTSHGVSLTHANIEELLKAITASNCGVLGATLKKDLRNPSWISAIHQLVRWLLLMLPVDGVTKVRIHIENRAPYNESNFLKALQETLEDELKLLLPARFAGLHLSLEIMDKDNPYNGYVDAIANCWGSSDAIKRKLLARTAWRGSCLLQTTNLDRVENLYRTIATTSEVSGKDWFDLCTASAQEPEHSLFHDMLEQLGEQAKVEPKLWSGYLQEVRQRLANKDFTSKGLSVSLTWLESYKNEGCQLPAIIQLQHLSSDLTARNHQGFTQLEQVNKVLTLADKLKDENAHEACQAILRVAIRATHHYDFSSSMALIEQWLGYPVAVSGLLNHAKLHSTLGQLYAFQGQYIEALEAFDNATQAFERLSDQSAARKDIDQTNVYRAIALMDAKDAKAAELVFDLVNFSTTRVGIAGIERTARSATPLRFIHYLLLRLLVSQPELVKEREAYLAQEAEWQSDEGHPWMLINAYRAWLLQDNNQTPLATVYMQAAVDGCFEAGGEMLNWMGHCLLSLSESLQLQIKVSEASAVPAGTYPVKSLGNLAEASTGAERLEVLAKLLPFNFH